MNNLVVIGAGGFGRQTLDIVEAINQRDGRVFNVVGVVDDAPTNENIELLKARNYSHLGTLKEWLGSDGARECVYSICIGNPSVRKKLRERLEGTGCELATLIHPTALVESQVAIGAGCIVRAFVAVSTNVSVGANTILNAQTTVGHDTVIGSDCVINPGVNISGGVVVGSGVLVGTGAQVLQEITIGSGATVGASACVTKDVPEGAVAVGIPAKWKQ